MRGGIMGSRSLPESDLRPARVDRELAARLTFGNPALARSITTLETTLRVFVEEFGAPSRVFQIAAEDLQDDRMTAHVKLGVIHHLLAIRLGAHLTEIVESLSNQRTLSVAQSVRAALETAGAATYYEDKFRRLARDLPGLLTQVDRCLYGQRFEWQVWQVAVGKTSRGELETFLNSQSQRERKPQIDQNSPPSVMTFIDALDNSFIQTLTEAAKRDGKPTPMKGNIRAIYGQLSDFVHPSIGTWKTYGRTEPEALRIIISSGSRLESLQFLWFGIGECAAAASLLGREALQRIDSLRSSVVR
jgi:hypothetical protein